MSGAGPWLLASVSPVVAILGVIVGAWMTRRREMDKLAIEQGERLRARRQEAYAEFYSLVFGIATEALEDYEPGVMKDVIAERFHDSLRLRAAIGLLGPEAVSQKTEAVLVTLSALDGASKDPTSHDDVPALAHEVRQEVDTLLSLMQEAVTESGTPSVAALPSRVRGLRRAGRPA